MADLTRQLHTWTERVRRRLFSHRQNLPYDAWLLFDSSDVCNLRCTYCISDSPGFPAPKMNSGKVAFIQIDRVLQTLERTGLTYKIVFTGGGEPLLIPNFVDACVALSRDHYIALHTNLTFDRPIRDLIARVDPRRVFYVIASLHADELERTGLTDRFIDNVKRLHEGGFSVQVHLVAHPDLLPRVPEIRAQLRTHQIELKLDPFVGTHGGQVYPEAYSAAERRRLDLGDTSIYQTRGKLCNAGFNAAMVLANGDIRTCTEINSKLGNINDRLEFRDELITCPSERCRCPIYAHDAELFRHAQSVVGNRARATNRSNSLERRSSIP